MIMRTNIDIDDDLMMKVLSLTGLRTKREAVEHALQTLLRLKEQEQIKSHRGAIRRTMRPSPPSPTNTDARQ
jgi:Arc/MetJ family transcription regulator